MPVSVIFISPWLFVFSILSVYGSLNRMNTFNFGIVKNLNMVSRRKFMQASLFTYLATMAGKKSFASANPVSVLGQPVVISTWDAGIAANKAAWQVLSA